MYFNKNKPQLAIFIIIWKVKKVKIVTHLLTCKNERVSFIKLSIYRKVRARVVVSWKTAQLVNTTEKQNEKKVELTTTKSAFISWHSTSIPLYSIPLQRVTVRETFSASFVPWRAAENYTWQSKEWKSCNFRQISIPYSTWFKRYVTVYWDSSSLRPWKGTEYTITSILRHRLRQ